MRNQVKISITIPAGINDNQAITIENQGEPGSKGGPNGDLHVVVRVKKSRVYKREGDHVFCEIPITYTQAVFGAEIEIPMVDGKKEKYKIPEGTATGTKFVLRGKGFKNLRGSWNGDFVFVVTIQTPKKLTQEQKDLLMQLAKTMNEQPPIKKRGFFG